MYFSRGVLTATVCDQIFTRDFLSPIQIQCRIFWDIFGKIVTRCSNSNDYPCPVQLELAKCNDLFQHSVKILSIYDWPSKYVVYLDLFIETKCLSTGDKMLRLTWAVTMFAKCEQLSLKLLGHQLFYGITVLFSDIQSIILSPLLWTKQWSPL